jgi:chromosome segregation ATPase
MSSQSRSKSISTTNSSIIDAVRKKVAMWEESKVLHGMSKTIKGKIIDLENQNRNYQNKVIKTNSHINAEKAKILYQKDTIKSITDMIIQSLDQLASKEEEMIRKENCLQDYQYRIKLLNREIADAEAMLYHKKSEASKLNIAIESRNEDLRILDSKYNEIVEEIDQKQRNLCQQQAEYQIDRANLQKEVNSFNKIRLNIDAQIKSIESRKNEISEFSTRQNNELSIKLQKVQEIEDISKDLSIQGYRLKDKEKELNNKTQEINKMLESYTIRNELLINKEEKLNEKEAALEKRNAELIEKEHTLNTQISLTKSKQNELDATRKQLEQNIKELEEQKATFVSKNTEVSELCKKYESMMKSVSLQEYALKEKSSNFDKYKEDAESKYAECHEKEAQMKECLIKLKQLEYQLNYEKQVNSNAKAENEMLKLQIEGNGMMNMN